MQARPDPFGRNIMKHLGNLGFVALGGGMLWQIATAPQGRALQPGDPGPWALPTALALLMVVLGLVETLRSLRARPLPADRRAVLEQAAAEHVEQRDDSGVEQIAAPGWPARAIFVAALLAYVALFTLAGFSLASFGFLLVAGLGLAGLSRRAVFTTTAVALATTLALGTLLAGVVGVPLPGVWLF